MCAGCRARSTAFPWPPRSRGSSSRSAIRRPGSARRQSASRWAIRTSPPAASPTDDGYGTPSAAIFGDANGDGVFDDKSALLGLNVQKYGRTTKLTKGQITGIDGTVTVCYEVFIIFCLESATFVDQLVIEPG